MNLLPGGLAIGAVAIYALALLLAGWRSERATTIGADLRATADDRRSGKLRALRYSLSLATLCSAWTYFGAVGAASQGSWLFLANALGPIIALTIGYPVWRKMALLAKQENVGSLADFLAARYGKSARLGSLCALVATVGALPYMALQLEILGSAWTHAVRPSGLGATSAIPPLAILVAVALVFGARRPSLSQQNRGFVTILSLEAAVKLAALLGCAGLAAALIFQGHGRDPAMAAQVVPPPGDTISFPTLVFLCTVTAFTLPRQFHVGFVTLEKVEDTRTARWVVPAYFAAWALATFVIAYAIRAEPALDAVAPAVRLLALPQMYGSQDLVLLALIGGLSAGAAMVIVELCATSSMITNEVILPLLRRVSRGHGLADDVGRWILFARRAAIALVGLLAWACHRATAGTISIDELGQIALTAFAQFLPALAGGLYWRRGHVDGAIAGISAGAVLWLVTIAAPALIASTGQAPRSWGHGQEHTLEMAILLSLSVNILLYVVISLLATPRPIDTIQARVFVGERDAAGETHPVGIRARMSDIENLLARFIGQEEAGKAMFDLKAHTPEGHPDDAPITSAQARIVEKLLAGVIGAPSARNLVSIAISAEGQSAGEFDRILDEAAHAVHFSRDLLQSALQGLNQGVSVVDGDLRLIAWNASYIQMLNLTAPDIYVGKPLSDLLLQRSDSEGVNAIRSNMLGLNGSIARSEPLQEEWHLEDGRILQVVGKPLSRGDYLSTLTDITSLREAERVLAQDKEALERRVELRTAELIEANTALDQAKRAAEQATAAQKRFVAAASHDLVQPLHAARLFISSVREGAALDREHVNLLNRADESVDGAHRLMRALLNLSRIETMAVEPLLGPVALDPIFASLCEEFGDQAEGRGLRFVVRPTAFIVWSDRDLLRSILQNLVLNAIRYTPSGTILVAARAAGGHVRLEVRDTGIGIDPNMLETAFGEYTRLPDGGQMAEGSGLGLAIVARIGVALRHPVAVRSIPNRGSVFSVVVPRSAEVVPAAASPSRVDAMLSGMSILCIDDEPDVLFGMKALLERWGASVETATCAADLPAQGRWTAIVADQLLPGETGLSILRRLSGRADLRILLTATALEEWETGLPAEGIHLIRKPAPPLQLRTLLASAAPQLPE